MCYVPLPGLCAYEKIENKFDLLLPRNSSPFIKLNLFNQSEIFQGSRTFSKLFESPPFQAIINFKWRTFARWRFFGGLFVYLLHFSLFTAAISMSSRQLMIISIILGIIISLFLIRYAIINVMVGAGIQFITVPSTYLVFSVTILPVTTGIIEQYYYNNTTPSILRFPSIIILWAGFIGFLCIFKNIGIFIIGKNCLKN
jgi:hypothetical protein